MKKVTRGRQLTKQTVVVADDGSEFVAITAPRASVSQLPKIKAEALAVLTKFGIDSKPSLADSHFGTGLRDLVINVLNHEPDSFVGLAARIYEHAAHIEGYMSLGAVEQAMNSMAELGKLLTIFDAYHAASEQASTAGKSSSGRKRGQVRESLVQRLRDCRREHMSQSQAIESLEVNGGDSLRIRIEGNRRQLQTCIFHIEDENSNDLENGRDSLTWNQLKELFKAAAPG